MAVGHEQVTAVAMAGSKALPLAAMAVQRFAVVGVPVLRHLAVHGAGTIQFGGHGAQLKQQRCLCRLLDLRQSHAARVDPLRTNGVGGGVHLVLGGSQVAGVGDGVHLRLQRVVQLRVGHIAEVEALGGARDQPALETAAAVHRRLRRWIDEDVAALRRHGHRGVVDRDVRVGRLIHHGRHRVGPVALQVVQVGHHVLRVLQTFPGNQALAIRSEVAVADAPLTQVAHTHAGPRACAERADGRQHEPEQQGDDGDHHQQLDQRETRARPDVLLHHWQGPVLSRMSAMSPKSVSPLPSRSLVQPPQGP